jgi:hypothetical protein
VGSLIFIVAFAWSEISKISFERYTCQSNEKELKRDQSERFNRAFKYAITTTLIALIISFLVMFYIPGTKW